MKRKDKLPELLSPAGSEAALLAALAAGADAVYLGMNEGASNARTLAENFSREQLSRLIPLCHAHGTRVYVTLNTLCYTREIASLVALAAFLYEAGADAVIVADAGLITAIHRTVPGLPIHASTQAFAHSTRTADALFHLGCSRVVLARELTKENIVRVTEASLAETEIFLHGALCVSHSGQCLFSSLVGGRSGNRGACAQPCRLPYSGGYPLSLKDYSLARHIPALIESGVASLKIEGRMKSPAYVYGVTKIFRRLLDEGRAATDSEMAALEKIFSRDGFTDGYFTGDLSHMGGVRRAEDKEASREAEATPPPPRTLSLLGEARIKKDEPATLTLSLVTKAGRRYEGSATASIPAPAQNAALSYGSVTDRLSKMGGTGFALATLALDLDDGLFLPVGVLNALRRDAVTALTEALRAGEKNPASPKTETEAPAWASPLPHHTKTALFYREAVWRALTTADIDICFLPLSVLKDMKEDTPHPNGVALPPVIFDSEEKDALSALRALAKRGVCYALVASLGQISLAREAGLLPFGDFRLNIANSEAASLYRSLRLCGYLAAAETTPAAARALGGSVIAYGRIPLMLTERCFVKEAFGCERCESAVLTDRRGVSFPVLREYPHRALIVNSLPTYLGDTPALTGVGTHMIFTTETPAEARAVLEAMAKGAALPYPVRRAFK